MKNIDIISTDKAPSAKGPYSQGVIAGDFLFCSGQIGITPATGKLAGDDIETQTRQVMKNLEEIMAAADLDFSHVVKTTVFIVCMEDFPLINKIYGKVFQNQKPARATVQVAGLPLGALIEIECIASIPK